MPNSSLNPTLTSKSTHTDLRLYGAEMCARGTRCEAPLGEPKPFLGLQELLHGALGCVLETLQLVLEAQNSVLEEQE